MSTTTNDTTRRSSVGWALLTFLVCASLRALPSRAWVLIPQSSLPVVSRRASTHSTSSKRPLSHRLYGSSSKTRGSGSTTTTTTTRSLSFPKQQWFSFNRTENFDDEGTASNNRVSTRTSMANTGIDSTLFFSFPRKTDEEQSQPKSRSSPIGRDRDEGSKPEEDNGMDSMAGIAAFVAAVTLLVGGAALTLDSSPGVLSNFGTQVQEIVQDPGGALERVVDMVDSMGPMGVAYFGVAYTIAEIAAVPAIPLTASAGFLFGPVQGTAIVLLSASVAAGISFGIGRTLLRDYVEGILEDNPKFAKLDKAIGKEGFKLMLLLRLSPIFPFALSNYLYGASSINFPAFFWGTLLGFAPGTIAYVYTGYVGKALTGGGTEAYPWYVYAGGLTLFAGFLKVIADVATRIVEEIEDEEG